MFIGQKSTSDEMTTPLLWPVWLAISLAASLSPGLPSSSSHMPKNPATCSAVRQHSCPCSSRKRARSWRKTSKHASICCSQQRLCCRCPNSPFHCRLPDINLTLYHGGHYRPGVTWPDMRDTTFPHSADQCILTKRQRRFAQQGRAFVS